MTEVAIDIDIAGVDHGHSAIRGAWAELRQDLAGANPAPRLSERHRSDGSDTKGLWDEVIVSLTTTGSLTAFVSALRLWLGRDRRRSVTVTVHDDGGETTYKISGENISTGTLQHALEAAVKADSANDKQKKPTTHDRRDAVDG